MTSIVICGKSYELTNEPKHGVVRKIRKERQNSVKLFLAMFKDDLDLKNLVKDKIVQSEESTEETKTLDMNADADKEMERLIREHPNEAVEFGNNEAEFNVRATISLAASHYFEEEDFDDMTEREIEDAYKKCFEVLGGDVNSFFEK